MAVGTMTAAGSGDNDGSGAKPGDVVEFSIDDDLTLF